MEKEDIVVSVVMITYGHEKFIEAAINGVFMQQTDFPVELIIANDCSPDSTDVVVEKLLTKAPSNVTVKYTRHESNLGMMPNFIWALNQANGKYIALCEGDDYWTEPLKLQKQVDFLELNQDYSMCFHSVTQFDQLKNLKFLKEIQNSAEFPKNKILLSNILHTVSFTFRMKHLDTTKLIDNNIFGGDRLLVLLMAEVGKLYFIKDNMAVYRIHPGGVSNSGRNRNVVKYNRSFIEQYIYIGDRFESQRNAAKIKIVDHSMTIATYYYKRKNIKGFYYIGFAIKHKPSLILKALKKILIYKKCLKLQGS